MSDGRYKCPEDRHEDDRIRAGAFDEVNTNLDEAATSPEHITTIEEAPTLSRWSQGPDPSYDPENGTKIEVVPLALGADAAVHLLQGDFLRVAFCRHRNVTCCHLLLPSLMVLYTFYFSTRAMHALPELLLPQYGWFCNIERF